MKKVTVRKHIVDNHIIREVIHEYVDGDGEWHKYVIIPRELALKHVRKTRAKHRKYTGYTLWMCIPFGLATEYMRPGYYSGPGRMFANSPCKMRSSRKYVVFYQSGGWDI